MKRLLSVICIPLAALAVAAQQVAPPPPQGFRISGTVVDAVNNAPLPRTRVVIAPVSARSATRAFMTTEDGRFVFDNLVRGKYSLEGERRGYAVQGFNQHEDYSTAIAVGPGLASENLIFRLQPDASISGKVTDEQNEPVSGEAQVLLFETAVVNGKLGTRIREQVATDDLGSFRFPRLRPGKYFVAVFARPWYAPYAARTQTVLSSTPPGQPSPDQETRSPLDVAYPATYYPGVTDSAGATPIVLHAGDRFVADLSLQAVPAVRLRYRASDNDPSQRIFIRLAQRFFEDTETTARWQSEVGRGDLHEITGLAPGHYVVHIRRGQMSDQSDLVREVDLTADADLDVDSPVSRASVSGTIKPAEGLGQGRPPQVLFRNIRSGEVRAATVSASGEFQEQLAPGTYDVAAVSNAPGLVIQRLTASGAKVAGRRLVVGTEAVQLTVTMSRGLGRVEGTVSREGKPVAGAMVLLAPQVDPENNVPLFRRDQSDSDGTFTLADVLPGSYTVIAIENGWDLEWSKMAVLKKYLAGGKAVEVEENGKHTVEVTLQ